LPWGQLELGCLPSQGQGRRRDVPGEGDFGQVGLGARLGETPVSGVERIVRSPRDGWEVVFPAYWFSLSFDDPAPLLFSQDFEPKPAHFAARDALLAGRPQVSGRICVPQSTQPSKSRGGRARHKP
jgi:hypothetical protein